MKLKMYLQHTVAHTLDTWRLNRLKAEFNNYWKQMRASGEKELTLIYPIQGDFEDDIMELLSGTAIRVIRDPACHSGEVFFGTIGPSMTRLDGKPFLDQTANERTLRCAMDGDYWLTKADLGLTIALTIQPEPSTKVVLKSTASTPLCQRQPGQHLAVLVAIQLLEVILNYWDNLPDEEDEEESEQSRPMAAAHQMRDDHHGGSNGQPVGWKERVKGSSYDKRD